MNDEKDFKTVAGEVLVYAMDSHVDGDWWFKELMKAHSREVLEAFKAGYDKGVSSNTEHKEP